MYVNDASSEDNKLMFGVPQGSLLGPMLYNLFTKEIETIAVKHKMSVQMYADDTQLYTSFTTNSATTTELQIESCLSEINYWMKKNFLKVNHTKSNLIIFKSPTSSLPKSSLNVKFGDCSIEINESVKVLGVILTSSLSFEKFILKKAQVCNSHFCNLQHIKNCIPLKMKVMLISNLILSTLDYCNAVLACATAKDLKPLQKIQNRAVRFAFRLKQQEHITPYLKQLHFLPVKYRIMFKLCLISFDIVNHTSPSYLTDLFETYQPTTTINLRVGVGWDEYMLVHNSNHNADLQKNISTKMTETWNYLPLTLRSIES